MYDSSFAYDIETDKAILETLVQVYYPYGLSCNMLSLFLFINFLS